MLRDHIKVKFYHEDMLSKKDNDNILEYGDGFFEDGELMKPSDLINLIVDLSRSKYDSLAMGYDKSKDCIYITK